MKRQVHGELREYLTEKEMQKLMRAPNPRIDLTKPNPRRDTTKTGQLLAVAVQAKSHEYEPLDSLGNLTDEEFMAFVFDEALDRVTSQEAALLRAPEMAERWHWCLGQLMVRVNDRLSEMASRQSSVGREYHRWRSAALQHKAALQERRVEAAPEAKRMKKKRYEAEQAEWSRVRVREFKQAIREVLDDAEVSETPEVMLVKSSLLDRLEAVLGDRRSKG